MALTLPLTELSPVVMVAAKPDNFAVSPAGGRNLPENSAAALCQSIWSE